MPQGLQTLVALLILLPGFVSAGISRSLSAQSKQTELERIIEALIFSFFTYVIYILIFGTTLPVEWTLSVDPTHADHDAVAVHRWNVAFLAVSSCLLGFGWGVLRSKDIVMSFLRACRLTTRTSRESVWNDVFYTLQGTVQVGLSDGRNLMGWVSRYSDSGGERSLFLERARWIQDNGTSIEVEGEGVLLTEKAGIEFVMFLDSNSTQEMNKS